MDKKVYFLEGALFLVLAQIMVGINIVFSKYALSSVPILFVLATRFAIAAIILLPLHWLTPAKKISIYSYVARLEKRDWRFILAQALCAGILFNFLMLFGLTYTDANAAGIITSTLPAIIAVMSWLILGEKISSKKMFCVFLATLGLFVIAVDKLSGVNITHSFLGDAIILLALLPEATYYILCKMYVNSLPIFLMSSLLNGINAILLFLIIACSAGMSSGATMINISFLEWVVLMILGLSSGFFYVFWYLGCQKADGVMTSLSTAVMPIATVVIAWMLLGEKLTLWQSVGMGLVMLSIIMYVKRDKHYKRERGLSGEEIGTDIDSDAAGSEGSIEGETAER